MSETNAVEKLVILGTGPAGLTAAIYAARAELSPLVIEGTQPGGQLTITTEVENYPGFPEGVQGPELMERFRKQAERFGSRFVMGDIEKVNLSKAPYELQSSDGKTIRTKALIICTGASAKLIGLENETRLMGRGVSACATCDGFFFKGMDVAIVGGGDTAMEEATFLSKFAKSVTVIHRRDTLRASKPMQQRAFDNPKIKFIWNSEVVEILGEKEVTGLRLKSTKDGKIEEIPMQGLFVAIGHQPNTRLFKGLLDMNEVGYLKVEPGSTKTKLPGVFAAGDVSDPTYRQAVSAAGTGCMAALDAERYLAGH